MAGGMAKEEVARLGHRGYPEARTAGVLRSGTATSMKFENEIKHHMAHPMKIITKTDHGPLYTKLE